MWKNTTAFLWCRCTSKWSWSFLIKAGWFGCRCNRAGWCIYSYMPQQETQHWLNGSRCQKKILEEAVLLVIMSIHGEGDFKNETLLFELVPPSTHTLFPLLQQGYEGFTGASKYLRVSERLLSSCRLWQCLSFWKLISHAFHACS